MENRELIGRKVIGFKFEDNDYESAGWHNGMQSYIGKIGTIDHFSDRGNAYIEFEDGRGYYYPPESLKEHLVEYSQADRGCSMSPQKRTEMNYFKTKNILNREITVVVVATEAGQVKSGYSVLSPTDKPNKELAKKIALGRAEKKNLTPEIAITESMKHKYILASIANKLLSDIERGDIVIKGIK